MKNVQTFGNVQEKQTRERRAESNCGPTSRIHSQGVPVLDVAPEVVVLNESSWSYVNLDYKTPHHLATLSSNQERGSDYNGNDNTVDPCWSTTPVIASGRYLVASCKSCHIIIWDLTKNKYIEDFLSENLSMEATSIRCSGEFEVQNSLVHQDVMQKSEIEHNSYITSPQNWENAGQPDKIIDLSTESTNKCKFPVVQLYVAPSSFLSEIYNNQHGCGSFGEMEDSIVILGVSIVGIIYVLVITQKQIQSEDENVGPLFDARVVASWHTGRIKSCSITALSTSNTIVVGYRSNVIEGWLIQSTENLPKYEAKLSWRASFDDSLPVTISAMMELEPTRTNETTCKMLVHSNTLCSKSSKDTLHCLRSIQESKSINRHPYLLVTLEHNAGNSIFPTSSMVEVINIQSIVCDWDDNILNNPDQHEISLDDCVWIEDHWVLPEIGREIVDTSAIFNGVKTSTNTDRLLEFTPHYIPSMETNSICSLRTEGNNSNSTKAAVTLSDGSLLVLKANRTESDMSWGVETCCDQLVFPFPPIGASSIEYCAEMNPFPLDQYIACCLQRGGTTYLVSTKSNKVREGATNTLVFPLPQDLDADSMSRRLQSFTAGNVLIHASNNVGARKFPHHSIPIFVYSWPGGLIDIYCCGLKPIRFEPPETPASNNVSLHELNANGSAVILQTVLQSIDTVELDQLGPLWKAARNEVFDKGILRITMEDLCSTKLKSFRSLLLLLSTK